MMNIYKILKHQIWVYLGSKSYGLSIISIYNKLFDKHHCVIDKDTDIVVEGYPRSANTYVTALLMVLNGDRLKLGRHLHGSAQLIQAIKQDIPPVLLVRKPIDAISSLIMRAPHLPPSLLLRNYISFHKQLVKYIDQLVVIDFYDATNNMDKVIEHLNSNFNITLSMPGNDDLTEKVNAMIDEMDMLDRKDSNVNSLTVGRPSQERKAKSSVVKKIIAVNHKEKLLHCDELYNFFMKNKLIIT
jgi:hypothetical protein